MLEARDLRHAYAGREVLQIAALDLLAGTVTALVGPNGSGKSTLLRLLAFVERPANGMIALGGTAVRTRAERRRARRRVTLVEQHPYLFRGSVRRNVRYALTLRGRHGDAAAARTNDILERMHLTTLADRDAGDLSAGEVQRAAVARALALEPEVLLLDEPLAQADRAAGTLLYHALERERERGTAVCIASHQLEDAYRWSDRVLALADGRATPVVPENLFRADLPAGTGPKVARIGPLEIVVVTDAEGPATIAIPADEILVSLAPLASSARNAFTGTVVKISDAGRGGVTLTVDTGVDLAVRITRQSLSELGIALGTVVVLSFKAVAVRVF